MNFYSVRDLRTESRRIWEELASGGEVVLTNNGKPSALMVEIPEGGFEETVQAIRQAKAMIALNNMRRRAAQAGFMTDEEINAVIAQAREGS
ncbi:MAG: type II toxin-antitoxin system Phd/YefM family antitoxin [Clostridia bacterium]|nr:type II toxin-antitoxin system Phd/YefM family antitoxin [Clostridia bacterium]